MYSRYWSCSKFADFIRGTKKPHSASAADWAKWRKVAKANSKVRYWLADTGLNYAQKVFMFLPDQWNSMRYYVRNRWIEPSYALVASKDHIPRGQWRDVGNRFLPCLFDSLVDYVEIELAWHDRICNPEKFKEMPFWSRCNPLRFKGWRSREAGVSNLQWQMALICDEHNGFPKGHKDYGKPASQAHDARELLELYTWWKDVYPNRPDPYEASGWSAYCDDKRHASDDEDDPLALFAEVTDKDLKKQGDKAHKVLARMEKAYDKEETDMLIRLIKIRDRLWT